VFGFGSRNFIAAAQAREKAEQEASALLLGKHSRASALPAELAAALREPLGAGAVVYALLLDDVAGSGYAPQITLLEQHAPAQAALAARLRAQLQTLPRSARLPLLDLAAPALRLLSLPQRSALLDLVDRLIAVDNKITLAEFVLQTVLNRRLMTTRPAKVTRIKYANLKSLRQETVLLLSLMAQVAGVNGKAAMAFHRGAAAVSDLGIAEQEMRPAKAIGFTEVRQALDKLSQVTPLAKPFLIRMLLAAGGNPLSLASADLLRCICAAIDSPVPDTVAATYTDCHWEAPAAG
jgi:hypothetical protein